jgi:hypothetical protein
LQYQAQAEAMVALVLADHLSGRESTSLLFLGSLPILFRVFAPRVILDLAQIREGREEGKSAGMSVFLDDMIAKGGTRATAITLLKAIQVCCQKPRYDN